MGEVMPSAGSLSGNEWRPARRTNATAGETGTDIGHGDHAVATEAERDQSVVRLVTHSGVGCTRGGSSSEPSAGSGAGFGGIATIRLKRLKVDVFAEAQCPQGR